MRSVLVLTIACGLFFAGCSKQANDVSTTTDVAKTGVAKVGNSDPPSSNGLQPAPIESGVAKLTPENTKIQFVGTHAGGPPNPRTGGFEKFTGRAEIDPSTKTLKSVAMDIETASLWTQLPLLTNHLNSPDFFDTREHPTAKFESTRIESAGEGGKHTVTGNLTLLATTKEISFPATVRIDDQGLTLAANFTIDRTEFGMNRLQDRVEKPVSLSAVIGEKTEPLPSADGPGGGPRGGGPGRPQGPRPQAGK